MASRSRRDVHTINDDDEIEKTFFALLARAKKKKKKGKKIVSIHSRFYIVIDE